MGRHAVPATPKKSGKRKRRFVAGLLVLAIAAVIAVVITLSGSKTPSGPTGTPGSVALAWGEAVVAKDKATQSRLQCARGGEVSDLFGYANPSPKSVSEGPTHSLSTTTWEVTLHVSATDGTSSEFPVPVDLANKAYLVCPSDASAG